MLSEFYSVTLMMTLNKRDRILFIHPVVFVNTFDNRRKKIQNLQRCLFYHKRNPLSKEEGKRIKLINQSKAKVSRLYHFSIQQPWQGLVRTSGELAIQKFVRVVVQNLFGTFWSSFRLFTSQMNSQSVINVLSFKIGSKKLCTESFQKSHVSSIFVSKFVTWNQRYISCFYKRLVLWAW